MNFYSFLLHLLDAIDYDGDREKFTKEFIRDTELQTFINISKTLSEDHQKNLEEALKNTTNDPKKMAIILGDYFTQEQLENTFNKTATDELHGFIKSINKTLSETQRLKAIEIIKHNRQLPA